MLQKDEINLELCYNLIVQIKNYVAKMMYNIM